MSAPSAGWPLGPWMVETCIGTGSQGEVWRGAHRDTGVPVAVKVRRRPREHPERTLAEFRREVRAVARLRHPGVVQVHDQGVVDARAEEASRGGLREGDPYLVMELADGTSSRLGARTRVRETLLAILDALAYAHSRGVLHRDLKPSNVLLVGSRPVLADFGLAHLTDDQGRALAGGTPLYMPPEQLRDDADALGPWSDLYAVGWLAWRYATGAHPWAQLTVPAVVRAHGGRARPRLPGGFSEGFQAWVDRLVDPAPGNRFAHAAHAAAALAAVELDADHAGAASGQKVRPELVGWRRSSRPARPLPGVGLGLFGQREHPVVGREGERDRLWALLGRAIDTGTALGVVLRGPAGLGKSRLARWLCERSDELGLAANLRLRGAPQVDPDQPFVELLARALRRPGALDGVSATDRHDLLALAGLGGAPPRYVSRAELHGVVARWVQTLARRTPLVVWIDDLQHTPDLLAFAARLIGGPGPLLVVATTREEPLAAQVALRHRLAALDAEHVALTPLPAPAQEQLVAQLLGLSTELTGRIARRTEGNPLFAVQLVGDWVERGILEVRQGALHLREGATAELPAELRDVWVHRVAQLDLDAAANAALEALAALDAEGAALPGDVVEAVPFGPEVAEALLDAGLATREEGGFTLVHGMLRESVLWRAERAARLVEVHRAAARALRHRTDRIGQRGIHWAQAGEPAQAAPDLLRAAQHALDSAAHERALDLLERLESCLMHAERLRADATLIRARVAYWRGELAEAQALLERARGEAGGDPDVEIAAQKILADVHLGFGRNDEAVEAARLAVAGAVAAGREQGTVQRVLAEALIRAGQLDEAREILDGVLARLGTGSEGGPGGGASGELAAAWCTLGALHRAAGDSVAAIEAFSAAADAFESHRDRGRAVLALSGVGDGRRHLGDLPGARAAYGRALELAEVLGTAETCLSRLNLGLVELAAGRHREAAELLARSREELAQQGFTVMEVGAGLALLAAAAALDEPALWRNTWARLEELGCTGPLPWADPDLAWPARLAAELGARRFPEQAARLDQLAADQEARLA